ncbi:hypothetical protein QAD02_015386 [Eretmocerus hayati]|uniref:Uncharacterized protein n=1 Tax=Eretmocerus hayati TaxID=131215 RepID=A0ACC2P7N6_9HYME|nr:hypothetical protein QAD02_015386 [Eretmocerus hayati]
MARGVVAAEGAYIRGGGLQLLTQWHAYTKVHRLSATRKISKCGYLFVAPGWDFSNPLNRTKRWQRRWFVLYDDGELTYSVDEHPETVPQARVDMTRVLEVAAAEDVTGHPHSLAITSPEGVTFVKGTCREETRWWADVLQVYSRNKGRHKRNATFPGGQTTILQITPTIRSNTPSPSRPRFNSCRSEPRNTGSAWNSKAVEELCNSVFPNGNSVVATNENNLNINTSNGNLRDSCSQAAKDLSRKDCRASSLINISQLDNKSASSLNLLSNLNNHSNNLEKPPIGKNLNCVENSRSYKDHPASSASPPTRDKHRADDKARRRILNQLQQHQSERIISTSLNSVDKLDEDACRRILLEHEREREGKLRDIAASLTQPRARRTKLRVSEPTRDVVDTSATVHQDKLVRGDPDGCGLDICGSRYSPTSELRVDLPAEDLLNIKKGWLMKQNSNKEWNKHWFVLRGCGLMFYRDSTAEEKGIMDGVIDLNTVTAVTPVQVARNYGFQTVTWDDRGSTVLSAVTAGIRSSWMSAIRRAANLPDPPTTLDLVGACPDVSLSQSQQESHAQSPTTYVTPPSSPLVSTNTSSPSSPHHTRFVTRASVVGCRSPGVERERTTSNTTVATTPSGRSILFSSDEEYRTASESGRRESGDWSEVPATPPPSQLAQDCNKNGLQAVPTKQDWSELPCAPPSPPLTRTALSRVKARSRSSSRSRVYKRSNRGSPPSSRHSTLDSVKSEDLIMAGCDLDQVGDEQQQQQQLRPDLLESQLTRIQEGQKQEVQQQSSLLVMIEHQRHEIEGLKAQLGVARTEASAAESELTRLRQHKAEAELKEKQLGQLVSAMQRSESQRVRDNELLESKLLETEAILRENVERCQMLTDQLESSHGTVERYQAQVNALSDKLSQGIEENERLYNRVRDLEGKSSLSSARERGRSFDSLSDLTNIDLDLDLHALDKERVMEEYDELRSRFEKAVLEIRAMRKELREAHTMQDALELEIFAHKQEAVRGQESNQAQVQLMAARIQDLTNKLAVSEKQVRTLKQKCTKVETRDKRRSLSLKGRESFQISQEVEDKLMDLENKIIAIEQGKVTKPLSVDETLKGVSKEVKKERKRETRSLERNRLRRKSLDSATSSEPMKVLIRLSALETKVASVTECMVSDVEKDSSEGSEVSESSTNQISLEILMRLRKFEKAVAKSKRRLDKFLGSKQGDEKAEKCLRSVNEILDTCVECKKNQANAQITESVQAAVSKLEVIFRNKVYELIKRRQQIAQVGRLDEREKLKLIAERIAFEFVILRQIRCLLEGTPDKGTVLNELVETSQLISNLKFKINGTTSKTYQNISYVQYLTRVLANKLVFIGSITEPGKNITEFPEAQVEGLNCLLQKQIEINEIIRSYRNEKLKYVLMKSAPKYSELERIQKSGAPYDGSTDNSLIHEAWLLAQETLNRELAQVEVSHFILRCGQIFEQNISSVEDSYIDFTSSQNMDFETWADKAQDILRQEMERTTHELSNAYRGFSNVCTDVESRTTSQRDHRQVLSDYVAIIAQKALIDARISLLQEKMKNDAASVGKNFVSTLVQDESISSSVDEIDILDCDSMYDAENVFIVGPASQNVQGTMMNDHQVKEQIKNIAQVLTCMISDLENLKQCIKERMRDDVDDFDWPKISGLVTSLASACQKSSEIREQIKYLTNRVNNMICKQCEVSQKKLTWLSSEHSAELERIRKNQENEIADIKNIWEGERKSLIAHYEHEASNLRDKIRKLELRLNAIDSEHSAHVNELRAAYQKSVNTDLDTDAETRKRFKEEIKQLRALCEKGLLAMENSHRRIIAELEEKHRQELESLRIEKEQALSEETQATLAALDAMRKAHEHEVQKEITKFKQEFIRKVQAREDIGILHKEHEEELEGIKQEILSLSAKYSSKCVESAALEEKVTSLTKQVAQAQQHIMQLDVRNRQLRAHLSIETNDPAPKDTFAIVTSKDNDLLQQREEIHRMQQPYKQEEAFQTPMILPDPSASMNYSPVYKPHGNCGKLESLSKADNVNEVLLNARSKNLKSQLDKSLPTDKLKSSFTYQLRKVKPVSLPYSSNLFVSEISSEERKKD